MEQVTLLDKVNAAMEGGATSMWFSSGELHTVQLGLADTYRLEFIVRNWGLDIEQIRVLSDLGIETMVIRNKCDE